MLAYHVHWPLRLGTAAATTGKLSFKRLGNWEGKGKDTKNRKERVAKVGLHGKVASLTGQRERQDWSTGPLRKFMESKKMRQKKQQVNWMWNSITLICAVCPRATPECEHIFKENPHLHWITDGKLNSLKIYLAMTVGLVLMPHTWSLRFSNPS